MGLSSVHGYPRIGPRRELKFATEGHWAGNVTAVELEDVAREIRRDNWEFMREAGIDLIPSNDFSFYDQVLDTAAMVGAVPPRFEHGGGEVSLDTYFAMARGRQDAIAMEMTKWFDTNYHYIVPELGPDTEFALSSAKPIQEFQEAKELGIVTKPVLIGPLTFLLLSKPAGDAPADFTPVSLLDDLLGVYVELLTNLGQLGCEWVQLDEPAFAQDRSEAELRALGRAYELLANAQARPKLAVSTYFDHATEALGVLAAGPVDGIGLDFHRAPKNLDALRELGGIGDKALFAGVVDGRNVWVNDLERSFDLLEDVRDLAGDLVVSTSCSLQLVPQSLADEPQLDEELRSWMAFAREKVLEVAVLARGRGEAEEDVARARRALERRRRSPRTRNDAVREHVEALTPEDGRRQSPFAARRESQSETLALPLFPTTTIGSFPQTGDLRTVRAAFRRGDIDEAEYERTMKQEIERVIRLQEELGLDVLVHGEPERNDMVQYFGEQLDGFAFTENAWVQSYGTRYVRPPIIYGDVARPHPITVEWLTYAQSLTDRPVKGMLTGPVTMLEWSYVGDHRPRGEICKEIALAIRDEVADLEKAGIRIIQVDEPALREGLPLRRERWQEYLDWAVFSFRVATSGVDDGTQIHTHLCYSEFGDVLGALVDLEADVASIEAARSRMELVEDLKGEGYPREVGLGVYDIHSPRVPSVEEMAELLREATGVLEPEQLWVNPDCGLKTRGYEEIEPSLRNMVDAAKQLREELAPARA
jgi:5-methyltetrahydropteroyltriglutamate--homocysteine methyltransferase